ncbi:sensor histidine kinase [Actinacidiphila acidipaludis]|uniref:Sensor histidine kinase n=1 Tax=Actinacidiphila acidipaludis TaxID=2873382 RepID=A0ABS7Q2S7_9ACTN|nr:sensor histidine kinase [Streptomyces acidipaludis]MBY8877039.1 sensor histidine kinase [Streptomyces acidipaludis]
MGRAPETRKQALVKLAWVGIWLVYLGAPVSDLADGGHGVLVTTAAALGLAAFVLAYLALVFLRTNAREKPEQWVYAVLVAQTGLSALLSATLGKSWLVLFVYVAVACGAALPFRESRWAVPAVTAVLAAIGASVDSGGDLYPALIIPALLGGFAMVGVKQLVRTMRELREARETVAQLAATEERLRLARDLHDLLGHSLSLITLKSELAGRMLPDRPDDAAEQVADIEKVSRQALVDVREAVSGYRRPTLTAELAGARTALASAGVTARVHADGPPPGLAPEAEGALAWALREAVTNVVRHSGAATCVVALETAGGLATLTVSDDGRGPGDDLEPGNGLTGLTERLILAGGTLRTDRSGDGGFVLRASVPLDPAPVGAEGGRAGGGRE